MTMLGQGQEELIHAFSNPSEFNVKHPLSNKWTLWYDDPALAKLLPPNSSWEDNLKKIATFDTLEDFWGVINNCKSPLDLPVSANYHLFKEGVKPMWEEPENREGGKWTYSHEKKKRGNEDTDRLWRCTMLAMIGQQFLHNDDICGAVLSIRKQVDRIAIWTKSYTDPEKTKRTGKELKELLELGNAERIMFQSHDDTAAKNSSTVQNKFSV